MRRLDAEVHIRKARDLVSRIVDFHPVDVALSQRWENRNEDIGVEENE